MSASIAQQVQATQAAALAISAPSITPSAGDTLLIIVLIASPSFATNISISGVSGATYIGEIDNTALTLVCFYAPNVAAAAITVTATYSGTTNTVEGIYVADLTGVATTTPFINWASNYQNGVGNTTADAVTSTGVNVTTQPALLVGFCFDATATSDSHPAVSTGTGFTSLGTVWANGGSAQNTANAEYKVLTATGSTPATFTCVSANEYDQLLSAGFAFAQASTGAYTLSAAVITDTLTIKSATLAVSSGAYALYAAPLTMNYAIAQATSDMQLDAAVTDYSFSLGSVNWIPVPPGSLVPPHMIGNFGILGLVP